MACTYLLQLIVSLKKTGPTILAHSAHQTPTLLEGAGFHGLDVDSVNSVAIILCISVILQVEKDVNCGSSSPSMTDYRNQVQNFISKMLL
jgi:hypothetical protein